MMGWGKTKEACKLTELDRAKLRTMKLSERLQSVRYGCRFVVTACRFDDVSFRRVRG